MDKEQKATEYVSWLHKETEEYLGRKCESKEIEYHDGDMKSAYITGWEDALENQWIKVEDRLPKKDERVFVLFKYRGSIMIDTDSYFGENFYNLYEMGKGWNHGGEKIIAWMPIPSFENILQANKDVLQRLKDR